MPTKTPMITSIKTPRDLEHLKAALESQEVTNVRLTLPFNKHQEVVFRIQTSTETYQVYCTLTLVQETKKLLKLT